MIHPLAADAFHGKASRGLDVSEVDRAKVVTRDRFSELFRIGFGQVSISKQSYWRNFEQGRLCPCHHRWTQSARLPAPKTAVPLVTTPPDSGGQ